MSSSLPGHWAGRQAEREREGNWERRRLCPNRICNSMLSLHFCVLAFHLWPPRDLHMNEPRQAKPSQVKSGLVWFGDARARLGHKVSCFSSSSTFHQMSDELSLRLPSGCRIRLRLQVSSLPFSLHLPRHLRRDPRLCRVVIVSLTSAAISI